ncbi:hypothetical protein L3Q65_01025 (plasmid) [Amycolatopsis sp. FU40]|uniref:hypothetical protein n=1 Tax=Amycolatopsis sp. FU40 TaxID=2914159 RepID=UPI001F42EDAC|nr:hypothetical protein [Amycolatopsis sp. FU40]UKD50908.1 hypothetical protein L3Q65_01025 [Amycolatopsis sp. FU40]
MQFWYKLDIASDYGPGAGKPIRTRETVHAPAMPSGEEERRQWAAAHLYNATGTGRPGAHATYYVTVVASNDPAAVGFSCDFC